MTPAMPRAGAIAGLGRIAGRCGGSRGILGIRYVAYRYSAFGAGNRRRSPLVSGTGMILPAL